MNVMSFPIDDMLLPLRGESCESSQFPRTLSTQPVFSTDVVHGYRIYALSGRFSDAHAPQGQLSISTGQRPIENDGRIIHNRPEGATPTNLR